MDICHWFTNCSKWPTSDYIETYTEPSYYEKCNDCRGKEKSG